MAEEVIRDVVMRLGATVQASVSQSWGNLQGMFQGISGAAFGFNQILQAGQMILGQVKGAVEAVNQAWIEAERVQARYANALRLAGVADKELVGALSDQASAFAETTTKGDEEIKTLQALLLTYGVSIGKMDEATRAALDFAAATGVDATTAARLLGRAAQGSDEALARYGIRIEEGTEKGKVFEKVLEKMNERFGGAAQAELETYAGKVQQVANRWDEFKERIGGSWLGEGYRQAKTQLSEWAELWGKLIDVAWFSGAPEGGYSKQTKAYIAQIKAEALAAEQEAKKKAEEDEKARLKAFEAEAAMIRSENLKRQIDDRKMLAKDEEDAIKKQRDLLQDILKLEKERTSEGNKRAADMNRAWATMTGEERQRFSRIQEKVAGGGWEGLSVKEREFWLKTPMGESEAERRKLFSQNIPPEFLAMAGAQPKQIEADIKHEIAVRFEESGDSFWKQFQDKGLPEIKKALDDLAFKTGLLMGEDLRKVRELEAAQVASAGGR